MLKNYMKEGQKLPLFGVGPYIVYGMDYEEYKKRVNRCIPWFPRKK